MITQPKEVLGKVIGYVAIEKEGEPDERQVRFKTQEEFLTLLESSRNTDEGFDFYTRIELLGSIDKMGGANPAATPIDTEVIRLSCRTCSSHHWIELARAYWNEQLVSYRCERCYQDDEYLANLL